MLVLLAPAWTPSSAGAPACGCSPVSGCHRRFTGCFRFHPLLLDTSSLQGSSGVRLEPFGASRKLAVMAEYHDEHADYVSGEEEYEEEDADLLDAAEGVNEFSEEEGLVDDEIDEDGEPVWPPLCHCSLASCFLPSPGGFASAALSLNELKPTLPCPSADDDEDEVAEQGGGSGAGGGAGGAPGGGQGQMLYIPGLGYIPLANFPGLGGARGGGPGAAPQQPEGEREWSSLRDLPAATQDGLLNAMQALREDGRTELRLLVLGKGGVGKSRCAAPGCGYGGAVRGGWQGCCRLRPRLRLHAAGREWQPGAAHAGPRPWCIHEPTGPWPLSLLPQHHQLAAQRAVRQRDGVPAGHGAAPHRVQPRGRGLHPALRGHPLPPGPGQRLRRGVHSQGGPAPLGRGPVLRTAGPLPACKGERERAGVYGRLRAARPPQLAPLCRGCCRRSWRPLPSSSASGRWTPCCTSTASTRGRWTPWSARWVAAADAGVRPPPPPPGGVPAWLVTPA